MHDFTKAVRQAVQQRNWYAALALALALPDMCGRLEDPNIKSGPRYKTWWDKYVLHRYHTPESSFMPAHTFLSGSDAYALRCAFLHEGSESTKDQPASKAVGRFEFIAPSVFGGSVHKAQVNDHLILQVDEFCTDICDGVDEWMKTVGQRADVKLRIEALFYVGYMGNSVSL